jgi:hypothetical protein
MPGFPEIRLNVPGPDERYAVPPDMPRRGSGHSVLVYTRRGMRIGGDRTNACARRSDDTNVASLSANNYLLSVYVEAYGLFLKIAQLSKD